ncbi:hypothetical protein K435DRAFT_805200 [Dendrothele bispora CBS 962.96]|uniref:Uncharacterized protein n=1 Tax=Dendrothele bispora (strain CBS 962.96) TaxID=1314807 RepID=A0A4S8LD62_DENBC|nr:hypothetical protein K435DRAFT_805200 [Dendrothele bispora CBS 962.96]
MLEVTEGLSASKPEIFHNIKESFICGKKKGKEREGKGQESNGWAGVGQRLAWGEAKGGLELGDGQLELRKGKERKGEGRRRKKREGKGRKGKGRKGKWVGNGGGKKRKGKRREGKERKGKERKGKEREGKWVGNGGSHSQEVFEIFQGNVWIRKVVKFNSEHYDIPQSSS